MVFGFREGQCSVTGLFGPPLLPQGPVSLAEYCDLLAAVPVPTQEEKESFAEYVAHAHSWYKHLSLYPPGTSFHFFLNRHAGCERKHGTPFVTDRTQPGLHPSQIRTAEYREAFGYLQYSVGSSNAFPLVVPVARDRPLGSHSNEILMYGLPLEIFDAGEARLTGAIHTLSASMPFMWDERLRPKQVEWPAGSGGLATLDRIVDRCRQMEEPNFKPEWIGKRMESDKKYPHSATHLAFVDPVLYELLAPERRRQQAEIIHAIDRVCDVIESHRSRRP